MINKFFVNFILLGLMVFLFSSKFSNLKGQMSTLSSDVDSALLISDGRVGKIEINMNVAVLKSIYSSEVLEEKKASGGDYKIYKIFGDNKKMPLMEMESLCADICLISRILIFSSLYKTQTGIGVGSTFLQIKQNYSIKHVFGGDNNNFIVYVKEFKDVCFLLRATGVNVKQGKPYEAIDIPDAAIITCVLIF